jgi:hypothetical protein
MMIPDPTSWILPATLIAALAAASLLSLAAVAGPMLRERFATRRPPREELDAWAERIGPGNSLRPSTWPRTGRQTVDGLPILVSPAGERVVIEEDGRIMPALGRSPPAWG